MEGAFFAFPPQMIGGPSTNIATNSTTPAVAQIGSGGTYVIANMAGDICYVAFGTTDLVTVSPATAFPIPADTTVNVALGPGTYWAAAQLASGTGMLAVIETMRVSEGSS